MKDFAMFVGKAVVVTVCFVVAVAAIYIGVFVALANAFMGF